MASMMMTVLRQCPECHRLFDLTDADDAAEWAYGHDCETVEVGMAVPGGKGHLFGPDGKALCNSHWSVRGQAVEVAPRDPVICDGCRRIS